MSQGGRERENESARGTMGRGKRGREASASPPPPPPFSPHRLSFTARLLLFLIISILDEIASESLCEGEIRIPHIWPSDIFYAWQ